MLREVDAVDLSCLKQILEKYLIDMKNHNLPLFKNAGKLENWHLMFPTLLPDGRGGPEVHYEKVKLRERISYVLDVGSLAFHSNLPFLFYCNSLLRRRRITGASAGKPIAKSVENAMTEFSNLSKSGNLEHVPDCVIRILLNQVSFHVNSLRSLHQICPYSAKTYLA